MPRMITQPILEPHASLLPRAYWSAYLALQFVGQARFPFSSAERIARDRDRRLRRMVAYAYRWVPYYRETLDRLGLTPADFRTVDDLRRLPFISVDDLQANPERLRSRQFAADLVLALHSSGSTGRPHTVWHDLAALYQNAAHAEREHLLWRQAAGKHRLRSLGIGSTLSSAGLVRAATRANALWPRFVRHRASPLAIEDGPAAWAAALQERRPDLLNAYGSAISRLVAYAQSAEPPVTWPPLVRYAADGLSGEARRWLNAAGSQVFSGYQAIEAFKMGFECDQHDAYHVNDDLYPMRIVNAEGRDCPPGVVGEVVVSNLITRGTVLLNYRLGDLAARVEAACPCGRRLSRISFVQGRSHDTLFDTHGQEASSLVLEGPITATPGVLEYQVRQLALDQIVVTLVAAPHCPRQQAAQRITAAAQARLGDSLRLEVRFVDAIDRTAGGKLRTVINEVSPL
jgi:phenylacetate-CoA ligase